MNRPGDVPPHGVLFHVKHSSAVLAVAVVLAVLMAAAALAAAVVPIRAASHENGFDYDVSCGSVLLPDRSEASAAGDALIEATELTSYAAELTPGAVADRALSQCADARRARTAAALAVGSGAMLTVVGAGTVLIRTRTSRRAETFSS